MSDEQRLPILRFRVSWSQEILYQKCHFVYDNDEVKFEFPRSIPKLCERHCTRVSRYHIVEGTIAAVNVTGFDLRAK